MNLGEELARRHAETRRGARKRLGQKLVGFLLVTTFLGALVQAALVVYQNESMPGFYAERFNVAEAFDVDAPDFSVVSATAGALGVEGSEVQMTTSFPVARTALVKDNWRYTAIVKEKTANSVTAGAFQAQLYMNEVIQGTVYLKAGLNTTAVEGATVTWNLGPSIEAAPLFVVKLKPFIQSAPLKEFGIKSSATGPSWIGVSAPVNHTSITGATNPAMNVAVGDMAKITWTNDDSGFHNLRITNGAGTTVLAGPTPNVNTLGQSEVVSYVLPSAGTYKYSCQYHPSMTGDLVAT